MQDKIRHSLAVCLILFSLAIQAEQGLQTSHAWVREAPPGAEMLAAYLTINNTGDKDRVLTEVTSPQFSHIMMHRSQVIDGVARMLHQDTLTIPAHGKLVLEPGGYHLMMPSPEPALHEGDCVELTLHLQDGETLAVHAPVKRAGTSD